MYTTREERYLHNNNNDDDKNTCDRERERENLVFG